MADVISALHTSRKECEGTGTDDDTYGHKFASDRVEGGRPCKT